MTPEECAVKIRWLYSGGGLRFDPEVAEIIAAAIREAVAEEREACALIAEKERRVARVHNPDGAVDITARCIANYIRARGEKP